MDRNTVTGIILIFLIFLGFSLYNNHRTGKFFEAENGICRLSLYCRQL
jgi:hypothetical protein